MDDETEALIRQLQQQDAAEYNRSRGLGRRERKAPEVYVPPPPGVGTLAKSDRPPESAKKDEGRRETRGRDQRDTRASTPAKSGGSTKSATQSAEKPAGGRASKTAEAPQSGGRSSRSRDASASTKPPLEGYVLHQEDIWKKVTPRPGGGDHCDIIYKRFDPATREEQPFHDCNRIGEYAKGENMKSLRSVTAVNRYLERRSKQKAKADRKAAAPKSAEKPAKSAAPEGGRSLRRSRRRPRGIEEQTRARRPGGDQTPGKDGARAAARTRRPARSPRIDPRRRLGPEGGRSAARRSPDKGAVVAPPDIAIETVAAPVASSLSSGVDAQAAKAMARYALEQMSRGIRDVAEQIRAERTVGGEGSGDERPS